MNHVPGQSTVWTWDGRDLNGRTVPSGIYLIRICSGESEKCLKTLLIR
jgi:flagellar hook assembly protein FlgD